MKKAFTLVELLVVISIIALLLSILMPALNKVRESAKVLVCVNNTKQINMMFEFYLQANKDAYPPYYGCVDSTDTPRYWVYPLSSFDKKWVPGAIPPKYFFCSSQRDKHVWEGSVSYGYNYFTFGNAVTGHVTKRAEIRNPSQKLLLCESRYVSSFGSKTPKDTWGLAFVYPPGTSLITRSSNDASYQKACENTVANRHPFKGSIVTTPVAVLWADGHAGKEPRGQIINNLNYWLVSGKEN